jgi:hypothetical protein
LKPEPSFEAERESPELSRRQREEEFMRQ